MKIPIPLIALPVYWLYKLWCKTLRYEEIGRDKVDELTARGVPLVFAAWHDEMFGMIYVRRQLPIAAVVSRSRDGEFLSYVLRKLGFYTPRGSSSRGGAAALRETLRLMREEGRYACLTVDGPRGPRHKVKDGAVYVAAQTGALVIPTRTFARKAWRFKSWDRFQLPRPFSKVRVIMGEGYAVPAEQLNPEGMEAECARLEQKFAEMEKTYAFSPEPAAKA